MAVDVGSAVGYLDLDISKFLSGLKSAQDEAGRTSTIITQKLDSVGTKLSSVGTKVTALVTTPIVGIGVKAVKTAANFESAMSKVSAISGATGDDLQALSDKASEMGETTIFTASQSAEALQYMAMAGWKTEDMLGGLEGIMNLAAASGEDLATTSDIVTDALTAFGLSAEDSSHFADVLAAASSNANTNVSLLGESFKYVAPVAGALGYSVEDIGVALGIMANSGIKAGQAGTSLRSAISGLISPSKDAVGWMERLGITLTNEDGTMKSFSEVMVMLRESMRDLTEEQQAQAASVLFGERAMSGMLAIVNASEEDYDKFTKALANADGTAKQMADTMNDNLSGQITLLKSQVEGLLKEAGNALLPVIKDITGKLQELATWFKNLSDEQKQTIMRILAIVAAIGPLLLIIGKVIKTISTVIKIINSIKTVVIALNAVIAANPVVAIVAAIIAAITALVAIFVHLYKTNDEFREKVNAAWEKIKEIIGSVIDFIKEKVSAIIEILKPLFEEIVGAFQEAWEVIKLVWGKVVSYFEAAWKKIKVIWNLAAPYFKKIWEGIKKVFSVVGKILGGFFKVAWTTIKAVWNVAIKFFTAVWAGIKAVFAVVKGVLSGDFSDAWEAIKNVWDKVVDFFKAVWEGIKKVFSAVATWFKDIFKAAWENVKKTWNVAKAFFRGIWDGIKEVFSEVADWFKEKFQKAWDNIVAIWSLVTAFFQGIWDGIKNVFSKIGDWFKEKFQDAVDKIKLVMLALITFHETIWEGIKKVFSSIGNWFKDKFQDAVDKIKLVFSVIKVFFQNVWDDITTVFISVGGFFKQKFQTAVDNIKGVFSGIKKFFEGIWDDIKSVFTKVGEKIGDAFGGAFKSVVNYVFEFIENRINDVLDKINGVLYILNKLPGVKLDPVSYISLPRLAKGGLAYSPTAVIVGDNKNAKQDPEVISPLSKLKSMLGETFEKPISLMVSNQKKMAKQITDAMQTKIIDISPLVLLFEKMVDMQKVTYSYNLSNSKRTNQDENVNNQDNVPVGDTFNFYTDRRIDEEEAARQIKKVKRDIAEGF